MAVRYAHIVAEIKFRSIYECSKCGKLEEGTTVIANFEGHTSDQLKNFMDTMPQKSYDMPYEWSYNGSFKCPNCKGGLA